MYKSLVFGDEYLHISVIRHDWNFKWDWLLWSDETKQRGFLAKTAQDGFGEHRDKKYPTRTMKYTVFLMLWAYIFF